MTDAITDARQRSRMTCESCGAPGRMIVDERSIDKYGLGVRCDTCPLHDDD